MMSYVKVQASSHSYCACVAGIDDSAAIVPSDTMRLIIAALERLHEEVPEHHRAGVADVLRKFEDAQGVPHSRALAEMLSGVGARP